MVWKGPIMGPIWVITRRETAVALKKRVFCYGGKPLKWKKLDGTHDSMWEKCIMNRKSDVMYVYKCHSTTCSFTEFESEGKNKKSPWQFHLSRHCLLLLATSQPHIHHQLSEKFSALGRECSWERCIPVLQKWHLQKSSCDNRVKIEIRLVFS